MLKNKIIAVVVPAYNEETQIGMVIETMPDFVDRIIIVNDNSLDGTLGIIKKYIENLKFNYSIIELVDKTTIDFKQNYFNYADRIVHENNIKEKKLFNPSAIINKNPQKDRIILINHTKRGGIGAAISSGYKWCKDHNIDCTAVMAGDGQMDSDELEKICLPIVKYEIDYVKGNRLIHPSARFSIPKIRFLGNSILSILTKIASGYWQISDTQTGYTAISKNALNRIKIYDIYKSYGMPNDLLVKLNIACCSLRELEVKPVYNIGEHSKMSVFKVMPPILWLLVKSFFKRLWIKYLFHDFHPLFILYNLSFILLIASIPFALRIIEYLFGTMRGDKPILNALMFLFLFISASQFLLFAMWMDIQDNERLYK